MKSSVRSNDGSNFKKKNLLPSRSLLSFSYSELKVATRNFNISGRVGEGGFGTVYKGYLDKNTLEPVKYGNGLAVAIKKLNIDGHQGHMEWVTEVELLAALNHPNIVKLIGFCAEDENRLLVYEYMCRGSLESHLFPYRSQRRGLSWELRMKIALGAARGLAFLHDADTHVIYRDFKAANILLDDQFNVKLSDFGLAKHGPGEGATHVSTRTMGTCGYVAPEYLATGHLSSRSDVYSFGVLLLELLSGRRAMDYDRPVGEQKVVDWARPYLENKKRSIYIMDPKLNGLFSLKGANKIASLAQECLNEDAKARPLMKEVLNSLESLLVSSSR
ncbi:hypothetical protein KP509_19G019400 [Ceratopteris richardii]|nr:hypothetical protein KP509_19G019400 [Ceratopteris richardii]KAH7351899.1 hypothetical protein KP509_19G019400 [Ceratopteris richardii]KAH7351902.1 hypothetical protein KP509_19G019400 [Ceratopteris richardii]